MAEEMVNQSSSETENDDVFETMFADDSTDDSTEENTEENTEETEETLKIAIEKCKDAYLRRKNDTEIITPEV